MESPETPSDDNVSSPLPTPPKKQKRKTQVAPVGRPPLSPEDKQSAKEVRKAKKLALIQQLKDEGKITGPEARRQAAKAGVVLREDVDAELAKETNDPILVDRLKEKYELQQRVIDIRGGKGISILDSSERITFLKYLSIAMGRHAACAEMKIDYRRFLNTFQCDPDFKSQVITTEESLVGLCMMQIYNQASAGDVGSAAKFISIRQGQQQTALTNRLQVADHKLKKMAVEAQIDSIQPTNRPSFTCFTDDELSQYVHLTDKVKAHKILGPEEMSALGMLSAKLIAANAPPSEKPRDFIGEVAGQSFAIEPIKESE